MKTGLPYGIINHCNSNLKCVFCGVIISKSSNEIDEHVGDSIHKENIENMEDQGISYNDIDTVYCKPCKRNLGESESVSDHVESDDHANWVTTVDELVDGEFINILEYLGAEKNNENVTCDACNHSIVCTLENIELHVNSFNHRANVLEQLKPLNGIFNANNDEEVWCKICDIYIDNTVQSIFSHIDDDGEHLESLGSLEDVISGQNISIKDYLSVENEQKAQCNMCNIEVLCDLSSLQEHIISSHNN